VTCADIEKQRIAVIIITHLECTIIAGFVPRHRLYEWFSSAENVRRYMRSAWRSRVEEPNNML